MQNNQPNNVFQRVEKKYMLSQSEFNLFYEKIEPFMLMDKYGLHTICNIYYDTDNYDLIRNSIEKPNYKEKLRLRSYGVPNKKDNVFLEIKKKYRETVFKRRISLSLQEAEDYLECGIKPKCKSQILNEIDYFINFYKPIKKVYIAYDRVALFGKDDENFRITFDHNIRSRLNNLDMNKGDYGNALLNSNNYVMEIKTMSALPLWLVNVLSELKIYPVSFSKYGNIYKQELQMQNLNVISIPNDTISNKYESENRMVYQNIIENRRNKNCLQIS